MDRLLAMVTPSSIALLLARVGLPLVFVSVPFLMVPLKEVSPPVPNSPALPMSSVLPSKSNVVLKMTLPPVLL